MLPFSSNRNILKITQGVWRKFHGEPLYEKKYSKAKVRELEGEIRTDFLNNGTPKENIYYICIACTTIDSAMKINKKNLSTSLFRKM